MGAFPVLETPRLRLRELTLDDASFYRRHFSDPDIVELSAFEAPRDLDAAKAELLEYCSDLRRENRGIRWGIVHKAIGALIDRARSARIGYDLAQEHRRKGIMTEALREMLRYGFVEMGLNRIEVHADPRNVGSLAVVERLGFVREGVLRQTTFFRGSYLDDVCLSLFRREWEGVAEIRSSRPARRVPRKRKKEDS